MNQLKSILTVLTFVLVLPLLVSAQQKDEGSSDSLAVEIVFKVKNREKKRLTVPVNRPDALIRQLAIVRAPGSKSLSFKVKSMMEDEAVRVEVTALPNDTDTAVEIIEEPLTSFIIHLGETVFVSEVTKFGLDPLQIRVVSVKPQHLKLFLR